MYLQSQDFDLGDFIAISHSIDTGQAAPTKQDLPRTTLQFRGEEDGYLNKMLTAGVIKPSVSGSRPFGEDQVGKNIL